MPTNPSTSIMPPTFTMLVSTKGTRIQVKLGDTIDFRSDGIDPPTSVTVTAGNSSSKPAALFGTASFLVPSQQTVQIDKGTYTFTAGGHEVTVKVDGSRDLIGRDPIKT